MACLRSESVSAELVSVAGKGHGMISGAAEMRPIMAFWARTLAVPPPADVQSDQAGVVFELPKRLPPK